MKKSIVALSAAAVLGGLGFAGSAHALAYFGVSGPNPAGVPQATAVQFDAGGVGHFLFAPYYSAQSGVASLLNITNTDNTNGKVVKVRFRGAANSDDVLDFTVFLSPGDVWTANVEHDSATGLAVLKTADKSCTMPEIPSAGVSFNTGRVDQALSDAQKAAQTLEGYVEVLNMADVPPVLFNGSGVATSDVNPLYTATKHVNGVAPCTSGALNGLLASGIVAQTAAEAAGLSAPTGGLYGSWAVVNQTKFAAYGGAQVAARAVNAAGANAYGNIVFSPQSADNTNLGTGINDYTADPLLRQAGATASAPVIPSQWFDLPDMSTPLAGAGPNAPVGQAAALSAALSKGRVMNDYVVNAADSTVPMSTDWVVSQPTRRYHAAVDYTGSGRILWNTNTASAATANGDVVTTAPASTDNVYGALSLKARSTTNGTPAIACLGGSLSSTDREEARGGASFSPGSPLTFCGEVFTLSFRNKSSVLNAAITNTVASGVTYDQGWASLTLGNSASLPVVGFAATSAVNNSTNGNFGLTMPHRW
ncbi:MAG: cell surface protein [Pseudomonadota bacterium]|nr:cell surface protein [Pseudomonadota bacterium]